MLRNAATDKCSRAPAGLALNHESLLRPTIAWAPRRAPSIASPGCTSSRQIIGNTFTSRPSALRSGSTRAP